MDNDTKGASGRAQILRPGMFSVQASADSRRLEFDAKNEVVVSNQVPVDYVFIGDSITHGWELNAYFGGRNRIVLNRGIGGDKPEYVLKRFRADVLQLKPGCAILMIGINDTWVLDNIPADESYTPAAVKRKILENITAIVDLAGKQGQRLAVCSILPVNIPSHIPGNSTNGVRNELIRDVNGCLKELCVSRGLIYVDYHAGLAGEDGKTLAQGLADDGIHPHVLGYNIMAEVLRETLARHGMEI